MKNRLSKRTLALLVAAGLLISVGTFTGVRAYPNIQSDYYRAHFYMNHLQVHLLENNRDVCGGANTLDGETKVTGALATESSGLGYKDDDNIGSVEPGKIYQEKIQAENGQDISQFVRITIRKYWVETKDGKVVKTKNAAGKTVPKKTTVLSPELIHLRFNGADGFNTDDWFINPKETTTESSTYYYKYLLKGNAKTDPLVEELMIDPSVAAREEEPVITHEDGRTIYTYVYKYDGCAFYIEADVQAIQTHNAQKAIESQWGPDIEATYSESNGSESGSLSLK